MVLLPNGGFEPLSAGKADGNVGKEPVPVVWYQGHGEMGPEGMIRLRGNDVVAQGAATAIGDPHGVVEERG